MTQAVPVARPRPLLMVLAVAVPALAALWAYWSTLKEVSSRWAQDPQYSHGYLVPIFAVVLLWFRRKRVEGKAPRPNWWGLPLLALGIGIRLIGTYFYYVWLDPISLLPCLAGACLMTGGRPLWRWVWPSILFLGFMIPLPFRLATSMSGPLQTLATICSTFSLQSLGLPALAEGNRILLDEKEVNIVEACSGLRMLVVFFALSAGMALVVQRCTWEKLLITLSAIPIALVANVIRITVTGVLLENVDSETANHFFHDLAGWFMMPLALGLLGLELTILSHLLVERTSAPLKVELDLPRTASPVMRPRRPWKRAGESKPGVAKPGVAAPSPAPVEEPAQA